MRTSIPRLHSVRLKSGASVSVIRTEAPSDLVKAARGVAEDMRKNAWPLAGYAIVAWKEDGSHVIQTKAGGMVGTWIMADFVRTAIAAQASERFIRDNYINPPPQGS